MISILASLFLEHTVVLASAVSCVDVQRRTWTYGDALRPRVCVHNAWTYGAVCSVNGAYEPPVTAARLFK